MALLSIVSKKSSIKNDVLKHYYKTDDQNKLEFRVFSYIRNYLEMEQMLIKW